MTVAIRTRHVNRSATRERLTVVLQRRSSTGETVIWQDRPVPMVQR